MIDLTLDGFEEALQRLRGVDEAVKANIGANAQAALEPVAEEARRLAPVRSGDYRDSITVSDVVADENGSFSGGQNGNTVLVGPLTSDVFYAWFLEFGTVNMAAQPVLLPAVEAHEALVFEILGERIGRDIEGAL